MQALALIVSVVAALVVMAFVSESGSRLRTFSLGCLMALGGVLFYALLTVYPFMVGWNWLMPGVFGLKTLDFWQALVLILLAGVLFHSGAVSTKSDLGFVRHNPLFAKREHANVFQRQRKRPQIPQSVGSSPTVSTVSLLEDY